MALKKKGTPERMSLLTESELKTLRSLISKAIKAGVEPEEIFKEDKSKKNKS